MFDSFFIPESDSIRMLSLQFIDFAVGKVFRSYHVEIQSSASFKIFSLVSWNFGYLKISSRRLLFLTNLKSPVQIWPWSLSMKGESLLVNGSVFGF